MQEFKKARPEVRSLEKSGGEGSFGLVRCLVRADGTGEGGLTGGETLLPGAERLLEQGRGLSSVE